jgi:hypothetical protein
VKDTGQRCVRASDPVATGWFVQRWPVERRKTTSNRFCENACPWGKTGQSLRLCQTILSRQSRPTAHKGLQATQQDAGCYMLVSENHQPRVEPLRGLEQLTKGSVINPSSIPLLV